MYREKNIISGKMFEAEFYPIFRDGRAAYIRAPKTKPTSEEQKQLNSKRAKKKLTRLIETNFTEKDIVVHGTYRDNEMPLDIEQVRRDIVNYLRRVKRIRKKENLPDLKYIYVIEAKVSKRTGVLRWHWHMIMSGMNRDMAEQMWKHGDWINADRLQPNERGCEALAQYLSKDPRGAKRWAQSKNLKKPVVLPPKDGHIKRRGVKNMATKYIDDAVYWERRYKGYRFVACEAVWNEYNAHWYVNVLMRKWDSSRKERTGGEGRT